MYTSCKLFGKSIGMQTYKNAPIKHAIIELRFLKSLTRDEFIGLEQELAGKFGSAEAEKRNDIKLNFTDQGVESSSSDSLESYLVTISDQLGFKLFSDRLVWNQQAPYGCWLEFVEPMFDVFRQLGHSYQVKNVRQVGVRFINEVHIPVPADGINLENYIRILPRVPEGMEQHPVVSFVSRFSQQHQERGILSNVQVSSGKSLNDHVSVILDIDVILRFKAAFEGGEEELKGILNVLRTAKNEAFEGSITDELRGLLL